jgi:alanine racemase
MAEAVVDLDAIARNAALLGERSGTGVMAVVKADGFGHGLVPSARAALAGGATWLGVTSCAEALALRAAGFDAPVLSWLHGVGDDFAAAVAARVDLSAATPTHLAAIAAAAERTGTAAAVHLKVDTGMSRGGATTDDWPELVGWARKLVAEGRIEVRGLWSHLACADEQGNPTVPRQIALFEEAVAAARAAGLRPDLLHLANSAAALGVPAASYDLVRVGIALYGVDPFDGIDHGLRPAMTLLARAVLAKRVPAGTAVSYHHAYVTDRESTLVLVPVGYADGAPRRAGGAGQVWIAGSRHPIAGIISMDQFVVDAGDAPVALGDEIVLFGPGDRGEPTAADWARWAGTNPHEILTGVGNRVPRRYVGREELLRG